MSACLQRQRRRDGQEGQYELTITRPVKIHGKVVAREPANLRVLIEVRDAPALLDLIAADAGIFARLYPGSSQQLEIEGARIVACAPSGV